MLIDASHHQANCLLYVVDKHATCDYYQIFYSKNDQHKSNTFCDTHDFISDHTPRPFIIPISNNIDKEWRFSL